MLDDLRAHPLGARGQQLHHGNVAVAIHDHAREAVAVAVEYPVAIRVWTDYALAQLERVLDTPADDFGGAGLAAQREHPHRDRGRRIVIAVSNRRAGRVEHPHARAGLDCNRLDAIDRLREDPGIAAANRSLAALFEEDPPRRCRRAVRSSVFQFFNFLTVQVFNCPRKTAIAARPRA